MAYKIYRYNNYFVVIDRLGNYFEEHCENVLVTKKKGTDSVYTIAFLAQNTERSTAVSQSFPNVSFADIKDEFNAPYASVLVWEDWYTQNTGVGYITSLLATSGLATEATLFQILNNMIASQDVEILLVRDKGNADKVVQQIREYDQGTGVWTTRYEDVDGTAYVPVGPLEYLDPSAVLNLVLAELIDIGITLGDIYSTIHVEEDDNAIPEGLTLPTQIVELYGHWDGAWQRLTTDGSNRLVIAADSLPLPTGAATQATLASVLAELQSTLDVNVTNATLAVTQSGAWTVTANQGTSPWIVGGTVALDAPTLAALETITVNQGTNPWTVNGTVNAAQSGVWTVALDVATLAALETVTVQQGTTPWVVSGTVALDAPTLTALENITVQNGPGAAAVNIQDGGNSITVDDGGGSLTVDGTITANQGTSPWVVSATDLDIRDLTFASDKVDASGSNVNSRTQDGAGTSITSTTVGLDTGLDVNIIGGAVLDVNLDQNNDQVQVYGSDLTAPIATDTAGHLQVDILTAPEIEIKNDVGNPVPISDAGGSITVDGSVTVSSTDLDIRDLVFATDKVDVSGSSNVAVTDGGGSLTVDGTVAATQSGTWDINNISGTVSLPTGAATETTLALVNSNTVLGNLTLNGINTKLTSVVRTPNLLRATGSGTIAPVVYDFSVANVGAANGTILGGTIKPGETLNFSAGTLNNSYAAASIAYDGTGTELVIIYNS